MWGWVESDEGPYEWQESMPRNNIYENDRVLSWTYRCIFCKKELGQSDEERLAWGDDILGCTPECQILGALTYPKPRRLNDSYIEYLVAHGGDDGGFVP